MRKLVSSAAGRIALAAVCVIAVATAIGVIALWPSGDEEVRLGLSGDTERAEVTGVQTQECPEQFGGVCRTLEVTLETGPAEGSTATIDLGGGPDPGVEVGDEVRVIATPSGPGGETTFAFADFERRMPMLWLALAFAALVIVLGRLRGALSLVGLVGSLVVVVVFIVPAIRDGEEPLAVAIFGALAVMLITISLAHGVGAKSIAAMLGTAVSLLAVALLASIFTAAAHLTGFASEEATLLATGGSGISIRGLLLAGMVIGALGVLDDVTVSQSSTVMALRAANPGLRLRELYRSAIAVGRDHISATVNTLVLAYVGAALPILLVFSATDTGFSNALNSELVASEIVAMLVGSIGLIAAVPITTGLAAALAMRLEPDDVADEHAHAH